MKKIKTLFNKITSPFKKIKYYYLDIVFVLINLILFFRFFNVMIWVFLGYLALFVFIVIWQKLTRFKVFGKLKKSSAHVFGYKGTGKDLTIQEYIYDRFGKKYKKQLKKIKKLGLSESDYFSNNPNYLSIMDYGYGCKVVELNDFRLYDELTGKELSYADFMTDKTLKFKVKKNDIFEGKDLIVPETHLALPNTEHNTLDKLYKSFPIFISLSRHLYNMNVIINSQEYNRPWVKIRNQQDFYIRSLFTFPRGGSFFSRISPYLPFLRKYLILKVRTFQESKSAENNMLPFDAVGAINELGKTAYITSGQAQKEVYEATNGSIREYYLFVNKKAIVYDTRYYHYVLFGEKAPK